MPGRQMKEQIKYPKRMEGVNMAYETFRNELTARRQRKEQITNVKKSMNALNKSVNGLVARRKSLDANPDQQIAELSQGIQELKKMVYQLAKKKGMQVDDDIQALDEELAKYGYSQEKPNISLGDQEKVHTVSAREMTGDSSYDRYVNLGKEIARKYNPHYKMS